MNIDQIQKINDMALNLMRQGLATSHDEAVAQAEKFFKGEGTDFASIRERMKDPAQSAVTNELSTENVKEILEKNTTFLVKTIKEFQEKIANLEKEISEMKVKNNYIQSGPSQMQQQQSQQPAKLGEVFGSNPIPRGADPKPDAHPRQGSFKSEDVSIEKFFYMGRK